MPSISIFGSPHVSEDAHALRLKPKLEKAFPHVTFIHEDPTEALAFQTPVHWIIDTVVGLSDVTLLSSVDQFALPPHLTVHDYDLTLDLQLLQKLGKLEDVRIIGIPPTLSFDDALEQTIAILRANGF